MSVTIHSGDALTVLRTMEAESVHCCVTSPPYFGLRDYGVAGQIGLEPTPAEYVAKLVEVFNEVRRVLRDDGTLWLNLGDSYAADRGGTGMPAETLAGGRNGHGDATSLRGRGERSDGNARRDCKRYGLKHKDLIGIPWRVAFALQSAGWYLRSDIIWHKPNPMPESVTDRPTRCHEYLFLLSKSERYAYDADAIKEPASEASIDRINQPNFANQKGGEKDYGANSNRSMRKALENWAGKQRGHSRRHDGFNARWDAMEKSEQCGGVRNKRDVWTVAPATYDDAHFATFPPDLIRPCILAGCPTGGTVLDPFGGSGTTGEVAEQEGRHSVLIELNPQYVELAKRRTAQTGLLHCA